MNRFQLLVLLVLFASLTGCVQVYFNQPQPADEISEAAFPVAWRGRYAAERDTITIGEKAFWLPESRSGRAALNNLAAVPEISLRNGRLYHRDAPAERSFAYQVLNDSIFYDIRFLVEHPLADSLVLRGKGNQLFLSFRDAPGQWGVARLRRSERGTILVTLTGEKDVAKAQKRMPLRPLTPADNNGKTEYLASPSAEQFRKFVQRGGFTVKLAPLRPLK